MSAPHDYRGVASVVTNAGASPGVVAASIGSGVRWLPAARADTKHQFRVIRFCPAAACIATPFLATRADDYKVDNLENLPRRDRALNGWTDNQRVTLRIDTPHALRSHHNHVELVKSSVAAPPSLRRADRGGAS